MIQPQPLLVTVMDCCEVVPTIWLPKFSALGLTERLFEAAAAQDVSTSVKMSSHSR